jgi:hypothetical protein
MGTAPHTGDRRVSPRFETAASSFAVLGTSPPKIGVIHNISIGGLCFEYVADGDEALDTRQIDLFILDQPWQLKKLPVRTVSNRAAGSHGQASEPRTRRCSVAFENLSALHHAGINALLAHHTQTTPPPAFIISS